MSDEIKPEVYFYLASPYSHPFKEVRDRREREISNIGAKLSTLGLNLFCPITQSHRLNDFLSPDTQLGHDECMRIDYALLDQSAGLIVAKLQGWEVSVGVALEIEYARKKGLMIYMLETDIFEDSQLISFVAKEVKNIKERYALSQHGIDKYGEPRYDTTKEDSMSDDKINKGASKEGKPSILNFPWRGLAGSGQGKHAYKFYLMHYIVDWYVDEYITHARDKAGDHKLAVDWYLDSLQEYIMKDCNIDLMAVNEVFLQGEKKHTLRSHLNYTRDDMGILINALGRHLLKGVDTIDEEFGLPHAAHAVANILMLQQILNRKGE